MPTWLVLAGHCQVGGPGFRRFDAAWQKLYTLELTPIPVVRWIWRQKMKHTYQFWRNLAPSQGKLPSEDLHPESKCEIKSL